MLALVWLSFGIADTERAKRLKRNTANLKTEYDNSSNGRKCFVP